ncbi:hypothetical protein VTO42DRAFT_6237 [Malbranchea cinnamomea]
MIRYVTKCLLHCKVILTELVMTLTIHKRLGFALSEFQVFFSLPIFVSVSASYATHWTMYVFLGGVGKSFALSQHQRSVEDVSYAKRPVHLAITWIWLLGLFKS